MISQDLSNFTDPTISTLSDEDVSLTVAILGNLLNDANPFVTTSSARDILKTCNNLLAVPRDILQDTEKDFKSITDLVKVMEKFTGALVHGEDKQAVILAEGQVALAALPADAVDSGGVRFESTDVPQSEDIDDEDVSIQIPRICYRHFQVDQSTV